MWNFREFGLPVNLVAVTLATVVVWIAGIKMADCTDELAERFDLSRAVLGVLLLAGVTSLPEVATSFTAAHANNAKLAVNNLLGSFALLVAMLAAADILVRRPLTAVVPNPVVLLEGAVNVVLLGLLALALVLEDQPLLGAGYWSWALGILTVVVFIRISKAEGRYPWVVNPADTEVSTHRERAKKRPLANRTATAVVVTTVVWSVVVIVAGYLVTVIGEALAEQTGLGASFVGATLLAVATSLPEGSAVYASVRNGLYTMGVSAVLGSNLLLILTLFGVDLVLPGEPALNQVGTFATVATLLGLVVTALFLTGVIERRKHALGRLGADSVAVLVCYAAGMVLLYTLRGDA